MPRQARLRLPGHPLHVTQRGNNRAPCFRNDADRILYLALLEEIGAAEQCQIRAYVLMTNHVHLLATPMERESMSELMRKLGQKYVQHFNRVHGRTGTLWEGRFKSNPVDCENYLLRCHRYIEMNPVRAGIVARPEDYPWSSYRANAHGEPSVLLETHRSVVALGRSGSDWRIAYRQLFAEELSATELEEIRSASLGGFALGSEQFIAEVEHLSGRCAKRLRIPRNKGSVPV
jgi:putative transposase